MSEFDADEAREWGQAVAADRTVRAYPKADARPALDDLADMPYALRAMAHAAEDEDLAFNFPAVGDDVTIGRDDLRRWAAAVDDILERTDNFAPWKLYAMAAGLAGVAFFAGVLLGVVL